MVSKKGLLTESSTYKAILEEGLEKGRREGEQKSQRKLDGALNAMSKACRQFVEAKLGSLPPEAAVIDRIRDIDKLSELAIRLSAASPETIRELLRSFRR